MARSHVWYSNCKFSTNFVNKSTGKTCKRIMIQCSELFKARRIKLCEMTLTWCDVIFFFKTKDLDRLYLCNWLKHGGVEAGVATARREGGKGGKVLDNLQKFWHQDIFIIKVKISFKLTWLTQRGWHVDRTRDNPV